MIFAVQGPRYQRDSGGPQPLLSVLATVLRLPLVGT